MPKMFSNDIEKFYNNNIIQVSQVQLADFRL